MQVIAYDDRVVLIPLGPINEAKRIAYRMDSDPQREEEDEDRR